MKTLESQSIIDIAIQHSGSPEAAFSIALKNGKSISDDLSAGTDLEHVELINKPIAAYYAAKNLSPATADNRTSDAGTGIFDETFDETFD